MLLKLSENIDRHYSKIPYEFLVPNSPSLQEPTFIRTGTFSVDALLYMYGTIMLNCLTALDYNGPSNCFFDPAGIYYSSAIADLKVFIMGV